VGPNVPSVTAPRLGPSRPGTTEIELDGRIHVYSPVTQQLVALNETASDVWRLCDGEHTAQEVVELLSRSYQVAAGDIRADVMAALDRFVVLGLLPAPADG
jgi:tRNA A58 N-methylase Trm61